MRADIRENCVFESVNMVHVGVLESKWKKKRRRIVAEILAGKRARVKTKRAVHDDKYKNIFILDVSYASAAVTTLLIVKNKSHWRHKICMNGIMNNNNRIYIQTHAHRHILWLHVCNSMYTTCEIQDFSQVWFSYGRVAGHKKKHTHNLTLTQYGTVCIGLAWLSVYSPSAVTQ